MKQNIDEQVYFHGVIQPFIHLLMSAVVTTYLAADDDPSASSTVSKAIFPSCPFTMRCEKAEKV
jgi:hypothetical protein